MKKLFTVLLILFCFSINSFSQNKSSLNTDSIKILQLEEKLQRKVDSLGEIQENLRKDFDNEVYKFKYYFPLILFIISLYSAVILFRISQWYKNRIKKTDDVEVRKKV